MCFHSKQSKKAQELESRYKAKIEDLSLFKPMEEINGFSFPKTPVITHEKKELIQHFNWGLIPKWAKDNSIRQYTLNARIETIKEKPSYRDAYQNRCLVIVDGFYEWHWLDPKGKNKQKYLISFADNSLFALGGIWTEWVDKTSGEIVKTYSIVTTESDEAFGKIKNNKNRMPVILTEKNEDDWLAVSAIEEFSKIENELVFTRV